MISKSCSHRTMISQRTCDPYSDQSGLVSCMPRPHPLTWIQYDVLIKSIAIYIPETRLNSPCGYSSDWETTMLMHILNYTSMCPLNVWLGNFPLILVQN